MPELIFFMSFALLLFGMFYCEIESWRDRPLVIKGVMITMPYLCDILDQEFYELPPNNMNDCFLKQQLKGESTPITVRSIDSDIITDMWENINNHERVTIDHYLINGDEKVRLPDIAFTESEEL